MKPEQLQQYERPTTQKKPPLDPILRASQEETHNRVAQFDEFRMQRTYIEGINVASVPDDERTHSSSSAHLGIHSGAFQH